MSHQKIVLPLVMILLLQSAASCEKHTADDVLRLKADERVTRLYALDDTMDHDWPADSLLRRTYSGKEVALRRARQLADMKWTTLLKMPSCYGSYSPGVEQTGAPYSLAYMTNTHLGTQVSFHTFMTALSNPYSVLYTENLRKSPYNGADDSASFYGTTCSNSVMYVLGIEPPYYTRMIGIIPGMKKAKEQAPDSIEICDVLWKTGHVMMVYDIERDDSGSITNVSLFETTRTNANDTWIRSLSFSEFCSYWDKSGIIRYQYEYLDRNSDYEISVFNPLEDEQSFQYHYNYDICPTLGDRCSYLEGQDVQLSVFTDFFTDVLLYKDNQFFKRVSAQTPNTTVYNLPYGIYRACLAKGTVRSGFIHFEVINTSSDSSAEQKLTISFSSQNASARYIAICDKDRHPYNYYILSDSQRRNGFFTMNNPNSNSATHYQICFKGKYGVVATDPKRF